MYSDHAPYHSTRERIHTLVYARLKRVCHDIEGYAGATGSLRQKPDEVGISIVADQPTTVTCATFVKVVSLCIAQYHKL